MPATRPDIVEALRQRFYSRLHLGLLNPGDRLPSIRELAEEMIYIVSGQGYSLMWNEDNGKKIRCPVQDRGPYARGRVLDFSLGAAREIGCDGLCRVTVRRAGYE